MSESFLIWTKFDAMASSGGVLNLYRADLFGDKCWGEREWVLTQPCGRTGGTPDHFAAANQQHPNSKNLARRFEVLR
jgi:hypothetical protein